MGRIRTLISVLSTFVSLVILPIMSVRTVYNMGIIVPKFDELTVIILGCSITVLTLIDGLTPGKAGALFSLIKYSASAYYSYKILNMFSWFIYQSQQGYAELYVDWGLWLILVISITLLSGLLSAMSKAVEKPKKEGEPKKS